MNSPTNTTPAWKSYMATGNPSDIVASTTVADAIGAKVDATSGQSLNQQLEAPTVTGGTATGTDTSSSVVKVSGGSVSRTHAVKLNDVISVKDFGAKGDGSTDDTAAIQAAITHMLSTSNSGGTVFFPDGHYSVSSPLIIGGSGITLLGHSPNAAHLITSSTTENIVEIGSGSSINEGVRITGLGFSAAHPQTAGAAIYSHGAVSLMIDNIRVIENVYNGIVLDSDGSSTMGVFISNFDLKLILNSGITIGPTTGVTDIFIQNGIIRPGSTFPYDGIHIIQGYGVYIQNIDITNYGSFYFTHAIEIAPGSGQQSNAILLNQVLCDSSNEENMTLGGSGTISDIQVVGSWFSTSVKSSGISFENKNTDGVTIASSTIDSNYTYGILLDKGKNIGISGNKIFANSKGGKSSISYDGIYVAAEVSHFSITNNQLGSGGYFNTIHAGGVTNYGVFVAAGASDDYIISLNRGFGNTSGIVYDGGTGKNKYVAGNVEGTA